MTKKRIKIEKIFEIQAAETGSGKTGAFCLPILQIVHETLRDIQEGNKGPRAGKQTSSNNTSNSVQLSFHDRTHGLGKFILSKQMN